MKNWLLFFGVVFVFAVVGFSYYEYSSDNIKGKSFAPKHEEDIGEDITVVDFEKYNIDYGFILDANGSPGTIIIQAPYQNSFKLIFKGKAAHAGMEPEKGINALLVASQAFNKIKFSPID